MKIKLAVTAAVLSLSATSIAATVGYQHPDVSIVAVNESLDSVLKSVGKEMDISVTAPISINPVINCNIQNQPIKRAFRNLLVGLSYSLVWADDGERLTGLVILSGDGNSDEAGIRVSQSQPRDAGNNSQVVSTPVASTHGASSSSYSAAPETESYDAPQMEDHEVEMALRRQEQAARMADERAEQEIAHKAEMLEERAKRESEMSDLAESLGLPPLQR